MFGLLKIWYAFWINCFEFFMTWHLTSLLSCMVGWVFQRVGWNFDWIHALGISLKIVLTTSMEGIFPKLVTLLTLKIVLTAFLEGDLPTFYMLLLTLQFTSFKLQLTRSSLLESQLCSIHLISVAGSCFSLDV